MNIDNMIKGPWKEKHKQIIEDFLLYMNKITDKYYLKGGTSLMECYELNRFSEDIDLDSVDKNSIFKIVSNFCEKYNYSYRLAKDTDFVKRFMINYGGKDEYGDKPLKIEISYRKKEINKDDVTKVNGINVYNINNLALMKANAYTSRDKIRDLFDVVFIVNHKYDELNSFVLKTLRNALEQKGVEQFDYIVTTQNDDLINEDLLELEFLEAFDKLGLITNEEPSTDSLEI